MVAASRRRRSSACAAAPTTSTTSRRSRRRRHSSSPSPWTSSAPPARCGHAHQPPPPWPRPLARAPCLAFPYTRTHTHTCLGRGGVGAQASHITRHIQLPDLPAELAGVCNGVPPYFVVNVQLPECVAHVTRGARAEGRKGVVRLATDRARLQLRGRHVQRADRRPRLEAWRARGAGHRWLAACLPPPTAIVVPPPRPPAL